MLLRLLVIEPPGAEHLSEFHLAHAGLDQRRIRVKGTDDLASSIDLLRARRIHLVQNDNVGEFDLLHQQINHGSLVRFFAKGLTTVA
jgi:hypothetical protein